MTTIESEDAEDEVKISEREELRLLDKDLKVDLMYSKGANFRTAESNQATIRFQKNALQAIDE